MMTLRRGLMVVAWAWTAFAVGACRPPEPTPTQNTDLGTDNDILLPTPAAWHDKGIAKGQAEWKPFRKPADAATADAAGGTAGQEATPTAADGAVEKEIRELVDEYNGLVKDGKYTEAIDYLTKDQAAIAEKASQTFQLFDKKLKEGIEVAPRLTELAALIADPLPFGRFLLLDIKEIKPGGPNEASAIIFDFDSIQVENQSLKETLTDLPKIKARFVKGGEGDWFIESDHIGILDRVAARLNKAIEEIDALVTAVRSGSLTENDLGERVDKIKEPLRPVLFMLASDPSIPPVEAEIAHEEIKPETPPDKEPVPEPKKPVTGG